MPRAMRCCTSTQRAEGDDDAREKRPRKFTVRFNTADPHQRTVIEILNQQGRYKAQFLTSAILHYVHCSQTPDIHGASAVGSEEIERIVYSVLARQQTVPVSQQEVKQTNITQIPADQSEDGDRDAIFKTLEAFRTK